jgi:uncharacterized cupin superfamily protein
MTDLKSSAPHIHAASTYDDLADWGPQPDAIAGASRSTGRLLFKGPGNSPEIGVWVCTPGRWRLSVPRNEFCYFISGRVRYTATSGAVTEAEAGSCVLFPAGYEGEAEVFETIRLSYMLV